MADKENRTVNTKEEQQTCDDTVYVLEGNPDEVFNAQGERLELTPEQKKEIESQI